MPNTIFVLLSPEHIGALIREMTCRMAGRRTHNSKLLDGFQYGVTSSHTFNYVFYVFALYSGLLCTVCVYYKYIYAHTRVRIAKRFSSVLLSNNQRDIVDIHRGQF